MSLSTYAGDNSYCSMTWPEWPSSGEPILRNSAFFYEGWFEEFSHDPTFTPSVYMEDPQGAQVPLVFESIVTGACYAYIVLPETNLEANTEYRMMGEDAPDDMVFTTGDQLDYYPPDIQVTASSEDPFVVELDLDEDVIFLEYSVPISLGRAYIGEDPRGLTELDLGAISSALERGHQVSFTAYDVAGNSTHFYYIIPGGTDDESLADESDGENSASCSASPTSVSGSWSLPGLIFALLP